MNNLMIDFESGDRSTPDEIEQRLKELIPTAKRAYWLESRVAQEAMTAEGIARPLLFAHRVEVILDE